ncbi:transglutaminase domain-containing protein [Nocardioides caeni]|uniref:Transglutaminase family protein n=1 Tax=Nocardioides caeni TaxID=574700 RepID=A0A4S8N170_9ACTN|nr:transglutaminase family protein [Nocardioides caeni]THV09242.1 transglutaminase family protein [Nocardioides caeni]
MQLIAGDPADYLGEDEIVDHSHPAIRDLARELRGAYPDDVGFGRAAFEHVRDEVSHSWDAEDPRITVSASEALEQGTGLCYPKAHLLAALLRADGIPTGLCYQLLTDDESTFMLHGLVAIHLEGSWHRQDPRGNKPGVDAQFRLDTEQLAWPVRVELGEQDYPEVFPEANPRVIDALRNAADLTDLYLRGLPAEL